MKCKILHILLFGILFAACKQEKKEIPKNTVNLDKFMIGNWQTTYIKIEMPTFNASDSTHVFEDNFSNLNSGKAQSVYNVDGTFSAWFVQANGQKTGESSGQWKTKGDSLYVAYKYLGKQVKAWYAIIKKENAFEGKVIYDWDNDGEFDDTLQMKTKRITLH